MSPQHFDEKAYAQESQPDGGMGSCLNSAEASCGMLESTVDKLSEVLTPILRDRPVETVAEARPMSVSGSPHSQRVNCIDRRIEVVTERLRALTAFLDL